jgi:hypothetical protein
MLTALAAVLAALARLMLSALMSALTWVLRLLARLVLSAALLLTGLLLTALLMLGIVGVLRHGSVYIKALAPTTTLVFNFGRPAAAIWKTYPPRTVQSYG